jgi:hypothetical protein
MKKSISDVDSLMRESLGGLVEAHPGLLRVELEPTFVARAERASKKVALLSGGGSIARGRRDGGGDGGANPVCAGAAAGLIPRVALDGAPRRRLKTVAGRRKRR